MQVETAGMENKSRQAEAVRKARGRMMSRELRALGEHDNEDDETQAVDEDEDVSDDMTAT
jgi:hypothetical protein